MKKFFKMLVLTVALFSCVFAKNFATPNATSEVYAVNANDTRCIATFADNETLNAIQNTTLSKTSFNVLNEVDYEIYDQNQYGTCYAFSLAQMLNLSYEYRTGEHIRLSAIALALQFKDIFFDEGSHNIEILNNSYNLKYVSEYDFPYELAKVYYDNHNNSKTPDVDFDGKEILDVKEYYSFPFLFDSNSDDVKSLYIENLKKALVAHGALAVGIDYKVKTSGDYYVYDVNTDSKGGHAMTLVGFDDNFDGSVFNKSTNGAFIILNSWGVNQEIIYMSYEDVVVAYNNNNNDLGFNFIYGVADFISFDERAETVSNYSYAYYGMDKNLNATDTLDNNLEIGYLISNTSASGYLSQIDLQPLYNTTSMYFSATDIEIYVGAGTQNLTSGSFEYLGEFDISCGTNKIVLAEPLAVSSNFAIKIKIIDEKYSYSYLDKSSQTFCALYNVGGTWQTEFYSNDNYNLIKTPFYLRAYFTDGKAYQISNEDNFQFNSANAVEFDLTSNSATEITAVGVEIYRNTSAVSTFDTFEMVETDVTDEFDINATTSKVSLTKNAFSQGTYKVIITVNGGEKQFIKFLFFDDGIDLFTFYTYRYGDIWLSSYKLFSVYSNSLSADNVTITIPSYYEIYYKENEDFLLDYIFNYYEDDVSISIAKSVDTSNRITKAELTFTNVHFHISRNLTINFIYENTSLGIYVTKLANATHSNPKVIPTGTEITLQDASAPNHTFVGWYLDENFTQKVSGITSKTNGQIIYLYAKFVENTIDSVAKESSYDSVNNLLTISLDLSGYNLSIYDTILISNISHSFSTSSSPNAFFALKAGTYDYMVKVSEAEMSQINTVSFNLKIMRYAYRGYSRYYSTLSQSVSVSDRIKITIVKTGDGHIYNDITNEEITASAVYVDYGGNLELRFVASENHYISSFLVDDKTVTQNGYYVFSNLQSNHTLKIVFEAITFQIVAEVSGNGSIDKSSIENVVIGSSITYNFTANSGNYLKTLKVDSTYLNTEGVTSYTFTNVRENHTIIIVFETYSFTITATVIGQGSIGHSLIMPANYGDSLTYTFIANTGYHLKQVLVDGTAVSLGSSNNYVFSNITENHSLYVKFEKDIINVSIKSNGHGIISATPYSEFTAMASTKTETAFTIQYDSSLVFGFEPDTGYEIGSILINNSSTDINSKITKLNIIEDVEVQVFFVLKTFTLKLNITGSGTSDINPVISCQYGDSVTYNFIANTGYEIDSVKVDNIEKGKISSFTFKNITASHTITVVFVVQKFEIKWYNYDGNLIATTKSNYNSLPVFTETTPTRAGEGCYVFDFSGWNSAPDGSGDEIVEAVSNASYYAQFLKRLIQYQIRVSTSGNGVILPSGDNSNNIYIDHGTDITLLFDADANYHISKIYIDDEMIDFCDAYKFSNVTENHSVSVVFKRNDFKVNILSSEEKGRVVGSKWLEAGERATYKIVALAGYKIEKVMVNGKEVSFSNNQIIIESASKDVEIVVSYTPEKNNATLKSIGKTVLISVAGIAVLGAIIVVIKIKKSKQTYDGNEL